MIILTYFPFSISVKDKDVMDVEKTYWALKGSGKLDLETFHQRFSSLLPEELIPGQLVGGDGGRGWGKCSFHL